MASRKAVVALLRLLAIPPERKTQLTTPPKQAKSMAAKSTVKKSKRQLVCPWDGCNRTFTKPSHRAGHYRSHTGEKPYICTWPGCTARFMRTDERMRHNYKHTGIKPFKCDECGYASARSDHLATHKRIHTNERPFVCPHPMCNSSFRRSDELARHRNAPTLHK